MAEDEDVVPEGDVVVLDEVLGLALELEGEVVVVELDELGAALGVVVVVVEDDDAGGVGGTTTVVEDELGGVEDVFDSEGVCCWQAPSASSTLAATAVEVSRVIDRAPSL